MSKKFSHITDDFVYAAIEEFDDIGLNSMLTKYESGPSTRWYIHYNKRFYDQKVIVRAAHKFAGGKGRLELSADQAHQHLEERLGFTVRERF